MGLPESATLPACPRRENEQARELMLALPKRRGAFDRGRRAWQSRQRRRPGGAAQPGIGGRREPIAVAGDRFGLRQPPPYLDDFSDGALAEELPSLKPAALYGIVPVV
jgi:hypothetical protein